MVANGITIIKQARLVIVKGKTVAVEFPVLDASNTPINLSSGYTGKVQGRETAGAATTAFSGTQADLLTLGNGKVTVTIPSSASDDYVVGEGVFAIELTKTAGTVITDVISGTYSIENGAVHPAA